MATPFSVDDLLQFYRKGIFPMADSRDNPSFFLMSPERRGLLPLKGFHIPKRLKRRVCQDPFGVTFDTAFRRVIEACAEPHPERPTTWINDGIISVYTLAHRRGYAHSVECWDGEDLVGGLYGVALGGAFFGESMFSRATDASKIALVHLVAHLIDRGYVLLDAQFHNPHLDQFGMFEVSRDEFRSRLNAALKLNVTFRATTERQSIGSGSGTTSSITGGSSVPDSVAGTSSVNGSSPSGMVTRSGSFTGAGAVQRITQIS